VVLHERRELTTLASFFICYCDGTTLVVLSLFNVGAGVPSGGPVGVVTGLAVFYGGITQMLAGMWEFKVGNNFGATAFT